MEKHLRFDFMLKDEVKTTVWVTEDNKINYVNYSIDPVYTAFGLNKVDYSSIEELFRRRCFPETRHGIEEILENLGLKEFDPELIVRKTHGVLINDQLWIRFEDEELKWDDVKIKGWHS